MIGAQAEAPEQQAYHNAAQKERRARGGVHRDVSCRGLNSRFVPAPRDVAYKGCSACHVERWGHGKTTQVAVVFTLCPASMRRKAGWAEPWGANFRANPTCSAMSPATRRPSQHLWHVRSNVMYRWSPNRSPLAEPISSIGRCRSAAELTRGSCDGR